MQGDRQGFINGKQHVKAAEKHSVECIVLLTLVYYFLVAVTNGTLAIYCLTSIDHAISLHVLEVPFSSMVSAHTIVCVYVLCTHYVCVPRPSANTAPPDQSQSILSDLWIQKYFHIVSFYLHYRYFNEYVKA